MSVLKMPDLETRASRPVDITRSSGAPMAVLVSPQELGRYANSWQGLADRTVVPNPFFEPWTMLPALRHLGEDIDTLTFLLIFGPAMTEPGPLWAMFPLKIQTDCLGFPIRTLAFWQYRYCALAHPLIDAEHVGEVLDCFWRWFEKNPLGCRILDTNYLLAEGPFHSVWTDFAIGRCALQLNEHPRCLQVPVASLDSYLSGLMSANHRRDNRRKERRLRESGELSYHCAATMVEADAWIEAFLRLELAGWKGGKSGGAFAKSEQDAAYFREVIRTGFAYDRVWLMSVRLNGRDIAMKSLFLAGDGSFSFKIAYAEEYWKQSPGVLLELEHLRHLFEHPELKWSDTCAAPRHAMYEGISNQRRIIRRTILSNNSCWGDVVVSLFPLLRGIKKRLRPRSGPTYLQVSTERPAKAASDKDSPE